MVKKIKKDNMKLIKAYLKETRGYIVRTIKPQCDGNYRVLLKEPTTHGLTAVTVNRGIIEAALEEGSE